MNWARLLLASPLIMWSTLASGKSSGNSGIDHRQTVLAKAFGRSSLYFVENRGQVADPARYYLSGRDRTLFAGGDGLTLVLKPGVQKGDPYVLRLEFAGARPGVSPRGDGAKGPLVNFITGAPAAWRTGLASYSKLVYEDLWPGIDLSLTGDAQQVKYEFRVKPGADPGQIRLRYHGSRALRREASGDLAVDTPLGTVRDERPVSFQERNGVRVDVATRYTVSGDSVGFDLAGYDRSRPLVIDPAVFVYASYFGGAGEDRGTAIAVDRFGAAYVTGLTDSPTNGGYDVFVAKITPAGTGLEYVTYLGGTGNDVSSGIAVDAAGYAYVTGYTNNGTNFPVSVGPSLSYHGGANDVFVLKLNPDGTGLVYSGFIGGSGDDREPAIAIDDAGSAYLTGLTYSNQSTFPTGSGFGSLPGADQTHNGDADAFAVKIKPDGSGLLYATYIGGSGFDNGYAIGVDAAGNAYIGGNTASDEHSFPDGDGVGSIPGPNTTYGGGPFDTFVVKLNATGDSFSYVAYIGGAAEDRYSPGLAVSRQGEVWVAGHTSSDESTFPTGHGFGSIPGYDQTLHGGADAFVVKINAAGTAFAYATYLGGSSGDDAAQAVAVDAAGNAYVTGWTSSTEATFPGGNGFGSISGPDTTFNGGQHDAFVVKLNAAGTGVLSATYIGGPGGGYYDELGVGVAVDGSGNAYVTGYTTSDTGFPGGSGFGSLPGLDQTYNGGAADAFVVKISPGEPLVIPVDAGQDVSVPVGSAVTLSGSTGATCSPVFSWHFVGLPTGSQAVLSGAGTATPSFTPDVEGVYTLKLTVSCDQSSGSATVHVNAVRCNTQTLLIYPRSAHFTAGSGPHPLTVQPAGAAYSWSWGIHQTDATLSSSAGQTVNYTPGQSTGQDVVHVASDLCGSVDIPITVDASRPPEATVTASPNPTQNAASTIATANFEGPVDVVRMCLDGQNCTGMSAAGGNRFTSAVDLSVLAPGVHKLTAQAQTVSGWGTSGSVDLHVRRAAILLLNGYNFCDIGPHPHQWWTFREGPGKQTIACEIRDAVFGPKACLPEPQDSSVSLDDLSRSGVDCPRDAVNPHDSVCVVDTLDGQGTIEENISNLQYFLDGRDEIHGDVAPRQWLLDDNVGLILIGHSYGGQIARAYAAKHPGKVLAVITLDTPHLGSSGLAEIGQAVEKLARPVANVLRSANGCPPPGPLHCPSNSTGGVTTPECAGGYADDQAIQYFTTGGANDLLTSYITSTPTYTIASQGQAIGGPETTIPFAGAGLPYGAVIQGNGTDNAVDVASQTGPPSFTHYPTVTVPVPGAFYLFEPLAEPKSHVLHNAILEEPTAWGYIRPALEDVLRRIGVSSVSSLRAASSKTFARPPVLPAADVAQTVLEAAGVFDGSQTSFAIPFSLETSAAELVAEVRTAAANPAVALTMPGGGTLTPAAVDGLTTFYQSVSDTSGVRHVFVVRNPAPGPWNLRTTVSGQGGGQHVPATGSAWNVTVSARSSLSLAVALDDSKYLPGEIANVRATLKTGGAPLSGATVSVQVTTDAGVPVASLPLFDDGQHGDDAAGDGVYGGHWTVGGPGFYTASVTASGSPPVGSFNRQTDASFTVGTAGATISGPFTESAPDLGGDGSYDALAWSFTLQAPAAGTYAVRGDLLAADGSLVTQATATVNAAAAGDVPVTLSFPGVEIYRQAKLGPYTLANLRITVSTPGGERLAGRPADSVVSGGPYWSWMSFQRDAVPQWTWTNPVNEQIVTGNTASLQWSLFDGNGATTFDLYYDTTGSGFAGTPIVTGLPATQGAMTYTWDLSALPDGVYFVYARVRNGEYSDAVYGGSIHKLFDGDGDGMPDAWETAHGLNPASAADAYLDPDGDGLSNFDEYLNGTDPYAVDTDGGGEPDLSEAVNGRDGTDPADDVTAVSVAGVEPAEGDSRGGEQVVVSGSGFRNGAAVAFGGTAAPQVSIVNGTRLVATTPAHALGTVDVTVTNPGPAGSAGKTGAFSFLCSFVEPPVASSNAASAPLCPGQDLQLQASGVSGATYSWTGPNGFTSSVQNPVIPQAGPEASGVYTVTLHLGSCDLSASTTVAVSRPATPVAANGGPVCSGSDLQLSASTVPGAIYRWTGPGGFSSSQQNPVLSQVQPTAAGTYSVTATVNGCPSAAATTQAVVWTPPAATVSGGGAFCPGTSAALQVALQGTPPWSLTWSDGFVQNGVLVSPATRNVSPAAAATYSVTALSDAHCPGSAAGGATAEPSCPGALVTLAPCRLIDTRDPVGPFGGPALAAGTTRTFNLAGRCGIPSTALAIVVNVTVTGAAGAGYLKTYPSGGPVPISSLINFAAGQTRANNGILPVSQDGNAGIAVGCFMSSGSVQLILDVAGYFQ